MAVRPILTAENPLLRRKSKKVTHFGNGLRELVKDLFDSLHAVKGLGLAAPQIGVLRALLERPGERRVSLQTVMRSHSSVPTMISSMPSPSMSPAARPS